MNIHVVELLPLKMHHSPFTEHGPTCNKSPIIVSDYTSPIVITFLYGPDCTVILAYSFRSPSNSLSI